MLYTSHNPIIRVLGERVWATIARNRKDIECFVLRDNCIYSLESSNVWSTHPSRSICIRFEVGFHLIVNILVRDLLDSNWAFCDFYVRRLCTLVVFIILELSSLILCDHCMEILGLWIQHQKPLQTEFAQNWSLHTSPHCTSWPPY